MDLEAIKSILNNDDPARLFKLRFEAADVEKGELVVFAPYQPQYARIKDIGDWHGGVMAAVLDVAGTFACALKAGRATPTMNLRIDYSQAAGAVRPICQGEGLAPRTDQRGGRCRAL